MNPTLPTIGDLPLGPGVEFLASNGDGLVALDKPPAILSHPNSNEDILRSVLRASYDLDGEFYFWEKDGRNFKVWLINRLDSPTSGIVLLSLDKDLKKEIREQFQSHRVTKVYHAIVKGTPTPAKRVWSDTLTKTVTKGRIRVKVGSRVPAKTEYQLIKSVTGGLPVSLLRLSPLTGRTHQLRVQCRKHGYPIIGDGTYGSFHMNRNVKKTANVSRMLLHASEIRIRYAFKGAAREFVVSSKLPDAFQQVLSARVGIVTEMLEEQEKASAEIKKRRRAGPRRG